jgi:hypothetical protein
VIQEDDILDQLQFVHSLSNRRAPNKNCESEGLSSPSSPVKQIVDLQIDMYYNLFMYKKLSINILPMQLRGPALNGKYE